MPVPPPNRAPKATCRKCGRTVIVLISEGTRAEVDPEVINTVPVTGAPTITMSRRVHADMCFRYVLEKERAEAKAKLRGGSFAGGVGKRPKGST